MQRLYGLLAGKLGTFAAVLHSDWYNLRWKWFRSLSGVPIAKYY